MLKLPKLLRKVGVVILGTILIVIGVALLALPGPGLVVIALGLFVLSLEFSWAEKHYKRIESQADKVLHKIKKRILA